MRKTPTLLSGRKNKKNSVRKNRPRKCRLWPQKDSSEMTRNRQPLSARKPKTSKI